MLSLLTQKTLKPPAKKKSKKNITDTRAIPGGFRRETLEKLRTRKPEEVVRHAVDGNGSAK